MSLIHFNNFSTTTVDSISNSDTSIDLNLDLPVNLSADQYCYLTLTDYINYEIIRIDGPTTTAPYTTLRGQQDTIAISWPAGTKIGNRVTRDSLDSKQEDLDTATLTTDTIVTTDKLLFKDADDSNKLKQALVSDLTVLSPWGKIQPQTASNVPSLDFTNLSDYRQIMFVFTDMVPITDGTYFCMRTSTNNGVNYDNGTSDYYTVWSGSSASATSTTVGVVGNNGAPGLGNDTGEALNGQLILFDPQSTAKYKQAYFSVIKYVNAGMQTYSGGITRVSTSAINAVRFLMASGNISSGTITAYGLKK